MMMLPMIYDFSQIQTNNIIDTNNNHLPLSKLYYSVENVLEGIF